MNKCLYGYAHIERKEVLKSDRRDNHLISPTIEAPASPRQNLGWEIGSPQTKRQMELERGRPRLRSKTEKEGGRKIDEGVRERQRGSGKELRCRTDDRARERETGSGKELCYSGRVNSCVSRIG
ncbi:hypothetical protein TorRG33x02_105020 [Trema orientale]|uniref:Uncharacterized protein n=1 Tax=Trema orientale TaxID=63057 RepID=A0A2P5F7R2_TREOI|nr:hypothetical protein TorRG33x02_105020 [Trema orientale]